MSTCIALLRGVNVGRSKRMPMADLRKLFEKIGCTDVRTLLNSGNVVFRAPGGKLSTLVSTIEAGIEGAFGFASSVIVITAADLAAIVEANPLAKVAVEPARHLVAFVRSRAALTKARPLLSHAWKPEAFAIGSKAAYLWCANGFIDSKLLKAFARATADAATTRNWATVVKLRTVAEEVDGAH
jgi:uncharacterized protein (DUF1697 family)